MVTGGEALSSMPVALELFTGEKLAGAALCTLRGMSWGSGLYRRETFDSFPGGTAFTMTGRGAGTAKARRDSGP